MRGAAPWLVAIALCTVAPAPLAGGEAPSDGVPDGMVAFFSLEEGAGCPEGWVPADEVAGRLVVGVMLPNLVGDEVGTPLGDQEDRTHAHAYTGALQLPAKNIAAADGGNGSGAASGAHAVSGTTGDTTSGLPFVQLSACTKP